MRYVYFVLIVLGITSKLYGQQDRPVISTKITQEKIKVDGVLDEEDWRNTPVITEFLTTVPEEGGQPHRKNRS